MHPQILKNIVHLGTLIGMSISKNSPMLNKKIISISTIMPMNDVLSFYDKRNKINNHIKILFICMEAPPVSEEQLEEVLQWIDAMTFSRATRNLSRDFSDGVLMAEVLKH